MATIDKTYFFGELILSGVQDAEGAAALQLIIDSREDELLTKLLGYELYKAYKTAVALEVDDTPGPVVLLEQRFLDLRDGKEYTNGSEVLVKWPGLRFTVGTMKKSLIANYVYWYYVRDNHTFTTGSGEKKSPLTINALPTAKLVRAWNEMIDWNYQLYDFLNYYPLIYPEYVNVTIGHQATGYRSHRVIPWPAYRLSHSGL